MFLDQKKTDSDYVAEQLWLISKEIKNVRSLNDDFS